MEPLEQVANVEKQMPDSYISTDGTFVTDEFLAYARPLIGPDLPDYVTLTGHPVEKP
jgi:hypothetical protein